jgi:type II secretory pathway predicted ATPase ExeA
MYEDYYGLSEKPFALTPNPRFVFQSEQYRAGELALRYGIAQKEGFMIVTGAPGTGKTTLCRDLLEKLDSDRYHVALIFNPFLNGVEMLQALLAEFGLGDSETTSRKELLDRLNKYLLQQLANGRTCIAIFDEAQHLSTEFLEQIRVLSNLETDREKLIQIILVGQPELLALIRTPQMAQLDQRVSVRCTLAHLSQEETARYIDHRLNVAGAQGRVRFQEDAVRLLHNATGGVPRLINLTCDRALLAGYTAQTHTIMLAQVRQAIASLRGEEGMRASSPSVASPRVSTKLSRTLPKSPSRPWARWVGGGIAAAVALVAALWWRVDGTAELLAWKAASSRSPRAAEESYEQLARRHPKSRQRENALLRLAQLQIAKGEPRGALTWLDVLYRDYPVTDNAERQYWTARALLAGGDTVRACSVARDASADVARSSDITMISNDCLAFDARQQLADSLAAELAAAAAAATAVPGTTPLARPAGAAVGPAKNDSHP